MPNKRLDDFMAESAAVALIKADQFVRTLEEVRKSGEAVKYRGRVQRKLIGSPVAVVTIDGMTIDNALGKPWESLRKYELVLGVPDELMREYTVAKSRYLEHKHTPDGEFAGEGHLTGWRPRGSRQRDVLGFGGWVWSRYVYVINFVTEEKSFVPPSYDPKSIKRGLKVNEYGGGFVSPAGIGDEILARVAEGLNKCLEKGVLLNPTVRIRPHVHRVAIDEIGGTLYRVGIYQLSQNAFSKLEAVCLQKRNL